MKIGLTLGKFAPFHRGHQHVIDTALDEVDHLIVLAYDAPDVTRIPLPQRAAWIRALYPTVQVIEAYDGPEETGYTDAIMAAHDAYITAKMRGHDVTHFYSSEPYGTHVSRALSAIDRRVDMPRTTVPVSGTAVRADAAKHRRFVHPRVYRDLVERVVFVGAPSTGKSTLVAACAAAFDAPFMPEYGREYWEAHQSARRLTPDQLLEIADGHRTREDARAEQADRYLLVDTDASTTRLFCRYYHGQVPARLDALADACAARYHHVFLCEDDIPYDDTWDRSGEANRAEFQAAVVADLTARGVAFDRVRGSVENRVSQVRAALATRPRWC